MKTKDQPLKAPYPYPGGKSRVADLVWSRLGNPDNYIEPFAGTLAALLRRPPEHFANGYRVETVNDANHYIVNFWRAVKYAPDLVAEWADWPVTEADLHARHKWLVRSEHAAGWRERMAADPEHFDPKVAGWWVWGQCAWIGGQWCQDGVAHKRQMPQLDPRLGVHRAAAEAPAGSQQVPDLTSGGCGMDAAAAAEGSSGICKIPELASGVGRGVAAAHTEVPTDWVQVPELARPGGSADQKRRPVIAAPGSSTGIGVHGGRPQLADAFGIGRGVNGNGNVCDERKRPNFAEGNGYPAAGIGLLGNTTVGTCDARRAWLTDWMRRLADRLRLVRTCYGHWSRICDSDSTLARLGLTGVFLDPPYAIGIARVHAWVAHLLGEGPEPGKAGKGKKSRDGNLYANDKTQDVDRLVAEVQVWCMKWGADPCIRIALCGYEGEHERLESLGWTVEAWEASGGYANQRRGGKGKAENAKRERIWFSPHTLKPNSGPSLFDGFE